MVPQKVQLKMFILVYYALKPLNEQDIFITSICCGYHNILELDKNGMVYYRDVFLRKDNEWILKNELNDEIIIDIKASDSLSYAKSKEEELDTFSERIKSIRKLLKFCNHHSLVRMHTIYSSVFKETRSSK